MEIDLSRLNKLTQAPEKPTETQKAIEGYKTTPNTEKPLKTPVEGLEGIHKLQRQADAAKQDIDRSLAVYKEYQKNTLISSQLQTEILKGAKAGEDIYSLFLKAVKVISLMTSNKVLYTQLEADIRTIYGQGTVSPLSGTGEPTTK